MYNDFTPLPHGKFKFTALGKVPPSYLLTMLAQNQYLNNDLKEYIYNNIKLIIDRRDGKEPEMEDVLICEKTAFPNEKEAKFRLNSITKVEQDGKKPVRCYECAKCGQWHLTSIPYKKWEP